MKKYYTLIQQKPVGPFSVEELIQNGIKKDDLIWFAGQENWIKAKELQELAGYFEISSMEENPITDVTGINFPPIPNSTSQISTENENKNPNTTNNELIKVKDPSNKIKNIFITIGILFILFLIIFFVVKKYQKTTPSPEEIAAKEKAKRDSIIFFTLMNDNQNTETSIPPNNNVTKFEENENTPFMKINESERNNPQNYLLLTYRKINKIFSKKETIHGTIKNNADYTDFSDIILQVTWTAKTGTELYSEQSTLYENIESRSSLDFKIIVVPPENAYSYEVKVVGATGSIFGPM